LSILDFVLVIIISCITLSALWIGRPYSIYDYDVTVDFLPTCTYITVGLKRKLYILSDNQVRRKSHRYLYGLKSLSLFQFFNH